MIPESRKIEMVNDAELRKTAKQFFVQSPADLAQSYVAWAEQLQESEGIKYGCQLDKVLLPLHPGDLMAVVARPGHGKSSWMAYMARRTALELTKPDEVVVYVSWEQSAEEIEAFFQSSQDYTSTDMARGIVHLDRIRKKAVKRAGLPVWVFGESKRHEGIRRPSMTVDYVYAAIKSMQEDYGVRPVLMCLDYVQIMPTVKGLEKTAQVDESIRQAKELAIQMGLPVIVGVQAARRVDGYKDPMPKMADAQWSSSIEQIADKQISLWRPIRTRNIDETPTWGYNGVQYEIDEDLMVISLLKQRLAPGYGVFPVKFKPQTLELWDYETRQPADNNGYGFERELAL